MLNLFKEAAKYPFNNIAKVGILAVIMIVFSIIIGIGSVLVGLLMGDSSGIVLSLLAGIVIFLLLIVMGIFLAGYEYRIIKFAINKSPLLPEYNEWKEMFVDGLKVFVARIGYGFISIIIAGIIGLIGFFITSAMPDDLKLISIIIFGLIILVILIILSFLFTMGIPHMIYNQGELGKAFKFEEIYGVINQIGLFKYVIMIILLNVIVFAISFIFKIFNTLPIFILQAYQDPTLAVLVMIILLFIYVFLITPYIFFFESRVIGSIYAQKDEQNI